MTPKEKADNLCTRFIYRTTEYVTLDDAKKCALIAVDEIIKLFKGSITIDFQLSYKYWQEVKTEIEKL
jgi:hypothetical protein